jgi:hypothetical protein
MLLRSPHCTAAPFIRRLAIEDISWQTEVSIPDNSHLDDSEGGSGLPDSHTWALDDALSCLLSLSSVSSLCLDGGNLSRVDSKSLKGFLTCFSAVEELSITKTPFRTFDDAVKIISAFPLLKSLHLDNVGWNLGPEDDGVPTTAEPSPPPGLQCLGLGNCYKRDVLHWLLRHPPTPFVSNVDLGTIFGLNTPSIGNYLHALAGSLEHLQLGFSGLDAGEEAGLSDLISFSVRFLK